MEPKRGGLCLTMALALLAMVLTATLVVLAVGV